MALLKKNFYALTRKERIAFASIAPIAIASGIALLGLVFAQSTTPIPASGGDYTEGFVGQPVYINPIIAASDTDKSLVRLLFQNLGDLADTIATSSDERVWKVRLKEHLRWHDGAKLTSDDVVFTVQNIQDPESRSPLYETWKGVTMQRLSELEIQFNIFSSSAFFPDTLKGLYVAPKHIFSEVPPANWHLSDYNLKPIGSGPFKFEGYEKRADGFITAYTLSRWSDYPGDTALLNNMRIMFFSQKSDLLDAFNSGKIDGFAGLEPQQAADIARPHEIFEYGIPNYYAVFLNQGKNIPLKDLEVRRALSIAVNREQLVATALGGFGATATGPIPSGTPSVSTSTGAVESSSGQTAIDILERAQWNMTDAGYRQKTVKNAKIPLEFTLTVPDAEFLTTTANILKNAWERIGARVHVSVLSMNEAVNSVIKNRDYEMILFGNVLSKNYDSFSFWHSSQRFYPGLNFSLYNNKKADTLIESIRQNADKQSREEQVHELQSVISADYPAVFLYSPDYPYVSGKNLHGVVARLIAEPADRFIGANYWYTKTARVLK